MIDMAAYAKLIRQHVPDEDIFGIVDAGSHDGLDCLALALEFPWAHALAIEGDPVAMDVPMLKAHGLEVAHAVLADTVREVIWYRQTCAPKISGIYDRQLNAPVAAFNVMTQRLEDVCYACNVPRPTILKVDCEGATLDVLMGLGDLIHEVRAMHLETEEVAYFAGMRFFDKDVTAWCLERGFREVAREGDGGQFDVVWVKA